MTPGDLDQFHQAAIQKGFLSPATILRSLSGGYVSCECAAEGADRLLNESTNLTLTSLAAKLDIHSSDISKVIPNEDGIWRVTETGAVFSRKDHSTLMQQLESSLDNTGYVDIEDTCRMYQVGAQIVDHLLARREGQTLQRYFFSQPYISKEESKFRDALSRIEMQVLKGIALIIGPHLFMILLKKLESTQECNTG